jgi:hypothetical protein
MLNTAAMDLMGLILLREHRLTPGQVSGLMAEQRALRRRGRVMDLCDLAVTFKYLTPEEAWAAQALHAGLATAPNRPKPLGRLLLEAGLVTPSQLIEALQEQTQTRELLGRILIRQGHLTETLLQMFLTLQQSEAMAAAA